MATIIGLSVIALLTLTCVTTAVIYRIAQPRSAPTVVAGEPSMDEPSHKRQGKSVAETADDEGQRVLARVDTALTEGNAALASENLLIYLNSNASQKEEAQALLDEVRQASSAKFAAETLTRLSAVQLQALSEQGEVPTDISFSRPALSKLLLAQLQKTLPEEQSRRQELLRQQQAEQARLEAERLALLRETLAREQAEQHQQLLRSRYAWSHPEGGTAHNWTVKSKDAENAVMTRGKSPTNPTIGFGENTSPNPTFDGPGSSDIYIEIDPKLGFTTYAGLKFTTPCMLGIQVDFTLFAERAGVEARNGDNQLWKSRAIELGDKQVFAFFPAKRP